MIKHIFIFILFTSTTWATLNDLSLGSWKNLSQAQASQLAELLSTEQSQMTIKEGKMQVVNGINYAVVFNHPDTSDCFSTFTYVAYEKSNPVHELTLETDLQQQFLGAVPGVKPCTEENLKVLFAKFAEANVEESILNDSNEIGKDDSISLRSEDVDYEEKAMGAWEDIDEEDLLSITEIMGLQDDRVSILEGKMQLVAGVNYVLLVKIDQNEPCLIPFNFVSWNKDNKFTALSTEMFEFTDVISTFSSQEWCSEMVLNEELQKANVHAVKPLHEIRKENIVQNLWKETDEAQTEIVKNTLSLDARELTIVEPPRTKKWANASISVLVQDKDSNQCLFIILLNSKEGTLNFVDLEENDYNTMMKIFYKEKTACAKEVVESISSQVDPKAGFTALFYSFFLKEEAAIQAVSQISKFEEWNMLSVSQIEAVGKFIKSEGKSLQPLLGMSYIDEGIKYILIMRTYSLSPCTMYVSYTNQDGNSTFLYSSLADNELTQDILQEIESCDEDDIAEFVTNSSMFILI